MEQLQEWPIITFPDASTCSLRGPLVPHASISQSHGAIPFPRKTSAKAAQGSPAIFSLLATSAAAYRALLFFFLLQHSPFNNIRVYPQPRSFSSSFLKKPFLNHFYYAIYLLAQYITNIDRGARSQAVIFFFIIRLGQSQL